MALLCGLSDLDGWRSSVAAIGNFDGVHVGHQAMIAELRRTANALGTRAIALTFDPPPVELLRPSTAPPRLMRLGQKATYLEHAGADAVLVLPTDHRLLELSPEAFFQEVLVDRLELRGIVEGPNFRFGRDRRGDVALLQTLCDRSGLSLTVVEPVHAGAGMISSSLIRRDVTDGDLQSAARMLSRPHEVIGTVVRGSDRGDSLGFPTANLSGITTLLPPDGVYAGRVEIDGRPYAAAIHIGPNSTFEETDRRFEAHLLDFDGNLYGLTLRVELIDHVRATVRFDTPRALVEQLEIDCARVRALLAVPSTDR
ncbi:MAG: bifunctional riboflavin kinase/FAD synthetase [Planctomycetaceae bacterium]